jgi:hypothetical protein
VLSYLDSIIKVQIIGLGSREALERSKGRAPYTLPFTQSEKLGLKDVFFGLYQYQYWSSAGRKVVLFVARKTSFGFYWYFKRQVFAETGFIPTSGL